VSGNGQSALPGIGQVERDDTGARLREAGVEQPCERQTAALEKILVSFGQHRKHSSAGADGSGMQTEAAARDGGSGAVPIRVTAEWQFDCSESGRRVTR
jgi:hypothetical protein